MSEQKILQELQSAVEAAIRATPPAAAGASEPSRILGRRELKKLNQSLSKAASGDPSPSQVVAAETALEMFGRSGDDRVCGVLLEHLESLPPNLFLGALRILAEHHEAAAFGPMMRALPVVDEPSLPTLLNSCGEMGDPRAVRPLLIMAARKPRARSHAMDALTALGGVAVSPLVRVAQAEATGNNVAIRFAAIGVLERIADPRIVPQLTKLVGDTDTRIRVQAVKALGAIESDAVLRPLVVTLSDADPEVRAAAVMGLARRPKPKLAPCLARVLNDPSKDVRLQAVKALGLCGDPAVTTRLRPLLSAGDEELELAAAESIARLGDETIVPDLLDRLQREMRNPGSEPGAVRIADALRRLKDDRAVLPLVDLLGHPEEKMRARAAEALGQIGDSIAVESVADLLQRDYSNTVQAAAAKSLGELKDPQAIPALEHALQQSAHVRCKAIIALGEIGGRRALRSLVELTKDPAATVRYHAATALGRFGDRSSVPILEPLVRDNDEMVRRGAFKALAELGDKRSENEIVKSAQTPGNMRETPPKPKPRHRFTLKQFVPDLLLGMASRQLGIYAGASLAVAGVVALVIWIGSNWNTDTVVVRGYVSNVSISGDGQSAAAMRTLGTFEVWDVDGMQVTHQSQDTTFSSIFFSPGGRSMLGITGDALVFLQFDDNGRVASQVPIPAPGESVAMVGTSPSGSLVATVSNSGALTCWNTESGTGEWSLQLPDGRFQKLAVAEAGDRAAGVTDRGELLIWDALTGELAGEYAFSGVPPRIGSLSFDTTGEHLAASANSGELLVWDTGNLSRPQVKASTGGAPRILRFVDSGMLLVSRGDAIETWSVEEEQPRSFYFDVDLEGGVTAAASADGSQVVVGADETSSLYVYDVASGGLAYKLHEE